MKRARSSCFEVWTQAGRDHNLGQLSLRDTIETALAIHAAPSTGPPTIDPKYDNHSASDTPIHHPLPPLIFMTISKSLSRVSLRSLSCLHHLDHPIALVFQPVSFFFLPLTSIAKKYCRSRPDQQQSAFSNACQCPQPSSPQPPGR